MPHPYSPARSWLDQCEAGTVYSRAFTKASLASMRIWISARVASACCPQQLRLCLPGSKALAACRGWG